jgi:hypothetical protein
MARKYKILLFLILIFGLLLRIVWFAYGRPNPGYFSSDEIDTVARTLKIATGDIAPSHFNKPTFYNLTILPFYGLSFGLFRMLGFIVFKEDFIRIFIQRPCIFYWFPRLISAVSGMFSILLVYQIAKKVKDAETGFWAALLYSVCYTSVRYAHMAKEDALMTFLILLCLFPCMKSFDKKWVVSICLIFIGSLFGGLATATKYTGGVSLLFPFMFFILGIREKKRPVYLLGIFSIPTGFIIGFCMGMPYAFLHPSQFLTGIYESTILRQIKGETVWLGGVKHYGLSFILRMLITEFGILFSAAGLAALLYIAYHIITGRQTRILGETNRTVLIPLILFTFIYFLILAFSGHLDYQYIMPLSPVWALCVSLVIRSMEQPKIRLMKSLVILILIAQPLYSSIKFDLETLGKDTRIQAAEWIENNIPPHQKITFDTDYYYQYHPPLRFRTGSIGELERKSVEKGGTGQYFRLLEEHQRNEEPLYNGRFLPMPTWLERISQEDIGEYIPDKLKQDGFQWVVVSSYYFQRIMEDKNPGWEPIREFYRDLGMDAKETARFESVNWKSSGPEIIVYRLGN